MSRGCLLVLIVAFAVIATAGSVTAQPNQGDVVFAATGLPAGGLYYNTYLGSMGTVRSGITLNAVKMTYGNGAAYVSGGNSGTLYSMSGTGAYVAVNTLMGSVDAIALDQDGTYMVASFQDRKIYRVSGSTVTAWVTISTTYGAPNAICRDGNTGDFIVGTTLSSTKGYLLRVSRSTRSYSAWLQVGGSVYGVDWVPQTGDFVVVQYYAGRPCYTTWYRSTGAYRYRYYTPYGNCVTVDEKKGLVYVGTTQGRIYEFYYYGAYRRYRAYGTYNIAGIDIWQDQNVSAYTYSNRRVRLYLKFPKSPSKSCYVALSTAPYPGIKLSTYAWINLKPDGLFFLTFLGRAPHFTYGFTRILSSTGYSNAYFAMPYTPTRIYATAVAVNPAFPHGVDIGNTVVVDNW